MIDLKTLTMQLIDGEADGIRICRIEGESLVTVVVPREKLAQAKALPDLPRRGIYYLLDEDHGVLSRVYAGQTTQGLGRLEAHKAKKEFWNRAIMFLDNENNIDRDVLDALEAKAIDFVRTHGSYETDNTASPNPRISPYKEQSVERLLESVLWRMQVLGYDLDRQEAGPSAVEAFYTKKNGIQAHGRYNKGTGHFTVLAGSTIALDKPIIKNDGAIKTRKELFGNTTERATLADDVTFQSTSTAATFVLGGSQNGWTEWVNDRGETLDKVYRSDTSE